MRTLCIVVLKVRIYYRSYLNTYFWDPYLTHTTQLFHNPLGNDEDFYDSRILRNTDIERGCKKDKSEKEPLNN